MQQQRKLFLRGKALPKKLSQSAGTMPKDWHYLGRDSPSF